MDDKSHVNSYRDCIGPRHDVMELLPITVISIVLLDNLI